MLAQVSDGTLTTIWREEDRMQKLGVFYHSGLQITFNTQKELKEAEEKLIKFYTSTEEEHEYK